MIRLLNKVTGGEMWVADARLEEYLAAGHKLAAPPPDADAVIEPEKKEAPKPKRRRTTKKG